MAKADLTAHRLRELLHYDPETGFFTRLVTTSPRARSGNRAGSRMPVGYIQLRVDVKVRLAHRLAVLYMTGAWPKGDVDHINGIKDDNRWANLRDVTRSVNGQNQATTNKRSATGFLGVSFDVVNNKYAAAIKVNGKKTFVGRYATAQEAHEAYVAAKLVLHPGFARHPPPNSLR